MAYALSKIENHLTILSDGKIKPGLHVKRVALLFSLIDERIMSEMRKDFIAKLPDMMGGKYQDIN